MSSNDLYHWWEEPAEAERTLCTRVIRGLLSKKIDRLDCRSLRELVVKIWGLNQGDYVGYWRLATGRQSSVRTSNLKSMCNDLRISYKKLEALGVLVDRDWPINLLRPELIMLKTHILNEGTLNDSVVKTFYAPTGKASFSRRVQAQYYNNDIALPRQIQRLAEICHCTSYRMSKCKNGYCTVLDATTSRVLMKIGVPPGRRSAQRVRLDRNVSSQKYLWRYHFAATLIEEGSCSLRLARSKRLFLELGYYRGVDITTALDSSVCRKLRPGVRTVIGTLPGTVQETVRRRPPLLMSQEINHLRKLHPQPGGLRDWPRPRPYEVRRCRSGKVIASWRFAASCRPLVHILFSYLNVQISSSKRRRMQNSFRIYEKHKERKLSDAHWAAIKARINNQISSLD